MNKKFINKIAISLDNKYIIETQDDENLEEIEIDRLYDDNNEYIIKVEKISIDK